MSNKPFKPPKPDRKGPDTLKVVRPILKKRKTLRTTRLPTVGQQKEICKALSFVLDKCYPRYMWQVGMAQDMVYFQNLTLNKSIAYHCPLSDLKEWQDVMRIGGEFLERYNLPRARRNRSNDRLLARDLQTNIPLPE